MTSMNCGCKIICDRITFEKETRDERGILISRFKVVHQYQQYVDVCGQCSRKEKLFNKIDKEKLKLAKEQFKIITEENDEEPEPDSESDDYSNS